MDVNDVKHLKESLIRGKTIIWKEQVCLVFIDKLPVH